MVAVWRRMIALFCTAALLGSVACSDSHRLSESEALALIKKGHVFETEGKLQNAYHCFKNVDLLYEQNDYLHAQGWAGAQRMRTAVKKASVEIRNALEKYRVRHGKYPASLDKISAQLSHSSRKTLEGFFYERRGKLDISLSDGLMVTSFDLSDR